MTIEGILELVTSIPVSSWVPAILLLLNWAIGKLLSDVPAEVFAKNLREADYVEAKEFGKLVLTKGHAIRSRVIQNMAWGSKTVAYILSNVGAIVALIFAFSNSPNTLFGCACVISILAATVILVWFSWSTINFRIKPGEQRGTRRWDLTYRGLAVVTILFGLWGASISTANEQFEHQLQCKEQLSKNQSRGEEVKEVLRGY